jgi:hypothetical protein
MRGHVARSNYHTLGVDDPNFAMHCSILAVALGRLHQDRDAITNQLLHCKRCLYRWTHHKLTTVNGTENMNTLRVLIP